MFVTMEVDHLLTSFILLLISNTGFSAEISVFVQTGDSVQLDIQTQEIPQEFDDLSWTNDKSENIVKYIHASKTVRPHSSYKNRVDFNDETFSLTLKNMQKTDSGLYTARTSGENNTDIIFRVSVIDAVEAPVLTVNSNWSSSDSCTVNFTCRAHDLMINSSYQNNRCSPEEVTSHEIYTLILNCSEESIICNHSNPVSWKKESINITQIREENERQSIPHSPSSGFNLTFILIITVIPVGILVFGVLLLYCCCKNNKGVKQSDDTDYDDVVVRFKCLFISIPADVTDYVMSVILYVPYV
ncbi:CD48 antigen-like isoform X2 [Megalobrama amblycephala]|uniref:CD48 antigen-like isoform X2 n=1 Tax=Megalobrama amblycephala TaxID=75352 RepID=UPI002013E89C|nr:CD48 antigen-like isoform X2 [Megalobrama amblycephala]